MENSAPPGVGVLPQLAVVLLHHGLPDPLFQAILPHVQSREHDGGYVANLEIERSMTLSVSRVCCNSVFAHRCHHEYGHGSGSGAEASAAGLHHRHLGRLVNRSTKVSLLGNFLELQKTVVRFTSYYTLRLGPVYVLCDKMYYL